MYNYILFAFLALLASAGNVIFNRISSHKIGPILSSTIKSFFIIIACLIISAGFGNVQNLYSLTNDQWIWIGVLGAVTCVDWAFYFLAIKNSYLEAFAPYEAACVLFSSNLIFSIFMFNSVTNNGAPLNSALFFIGLVCLLVGMIFILKNKKLNPSSKKLWVLYATVSAIAMGFTLLIVKTKLSEVPSDIISFHQMTIVLVLNLVLLLVGKEKYEVKNIKWKDVLFFFIGACFNALLMVFRYKALSYANAIPSIVNVIISLDFVLVSIATVLFFKANNKKELVILILIVVSGMVLNVVSGLV